MSRLKLVDYRRAVQALKNYDYNFKNARIIFYDILNLDSAPLGETRGIGERTDTVANKVIRLDDDVELKEYVRQYMAVKNTLESINKDSKRLFEHYYRQNESKWKVMEKINLAERTFGRRKQELIYSVDKELKKLDTINAIGNFSKEFL